MQIKGYKVLSLPLADDDTSPFSSFLYVRQHSSKAAEDLPEGRTLFVANVPTRSDVDMAAYFSAAFGQYGEVEEVRVKQEEDDQETHTQTDTHTQTRCAIGFVIFRTSKSLKSALNAKGALERLPAPTLATMKDKKKKQQQQQKNKQKATGGSTQEKNEDGGAGGIQLLIKRFRARVPQVKALQAEVDTFMASFEQAEAEEAKRRKEAASQPDADGFVTVSYGKKKRGRGPGTDVGKKRGRSGSHKKKKGKGELTNFYSHQIREAKREQLATLRQRFEEDKARIEKMKAARKFKPFG